MSVRNIKNLVLKDLSLLTGPVVIIFYIIPALMLFIPAYPRPATMFYLLVSIMNMFSFDLMGKDHEFSGLLPVKKKESVLARLAAMMLLQILLLVFTAPFAILSNYLLDRWDAANNPAGMNTNIVSYAIILVFYGIFNLIVLPGAYKKQFKVSLRSIIGLFVFIVGATITENLICRPSGGILFLNGTSGHDLLLQTPILIGALILYCVINCIAYIRARNNYKKTDI
ncbi:MAG: ABC-2 transporter permease [Clostridia bacterium]|nr:ABC-2 transporter permease [Clostridia bacterium]